MNRNGNQISNKRIQKMLINKYAHFNNMQRLLRCPQDCSASNTNITPNIVNVAETLGNAVDGRITSSSNH